MSVAASKHHVDLPASITDESLNRLRRHVVSSGSDTIEVGEVFSGRSLATLPASTADDVDRAVTSARRAQAAWAQTSIRDRMSVFKRFHALLFEHREEILDLLQAETGKSRRDAFEEFCDPAMVTGYYLSQAPKLLRPRRRKGSMPVVVSATEHRHPKGVVGVISPWNYPFALSISDLVPALMAGNGLVLKPATETPLTALLGVELLHRAGLPPNLLQAVLGPGRVVGGALIDSSDFIAFTGSTGTGREVGRQAGQRLIDCSLELGGKNPMVVLDDADLDAAVTDAAGSAFANAGQLCMHIERVYVPRHLFDEFTGRLAERAGNLKVGAGYGYETEMGSLISEDQLSSVSAQVEDARAKGATVPAGGRARPDLGPCFYEPTVLTGVTADMEVHASETFGPVVSVHPYRDEAEAIALANDTDYGLNAAVHGKNRNRAAAVATRLRAGTVNVNDAHAAAYSSIDGPMGGVGQSGLGTRHGSHGLLKYTDAQNLAVQQVRVLTPPDGTDWKKHTAMIAGSLKLLRRIGLR